MVISHEQSNDKTLVGLKTDSVISTRSSSRGANTRTSTSSGIAEKSDAPCKETSTTTCRNSDWQTVKRSLKGLWKSAHGSAFKRS